MIELLEMFGLAFTWALLSVLGALACAAILLFGLVWIIRKLEV